MREDRVELPHTTSLPLTKPMSEENKPLPAVIFPSMQTARAVVALVSGKKPVGWSKKSRSTYYSEFYAKQLLPAIDSQIKEGRDIFYPWDVFCDPKKQGTVSINTLYLKVHQQIKYICERMDPEGKYTTWYQGVHVRKKEGYGLRITLKPSEVAQKPVLMVHRSDMPMWRRDFDEWLESDDVEPFVRDNLALTADEVKTFLKEVEDLSSVICNITSSQIQVVKVSAQ